MDISLYRMIPPDAQDTVFVNSVSLMNVISHEIEDVVINNGLPVDFYAGFQRFSYFMRQIKRYRRLAAVCRRVYVWGVPDVDPPPMPGIEFIPLSPDMDLAREWFLVVDTPGFFTALLTQEQTYGQDLPKGQRRFQGLWTYDADLVGRAYLLISQILGLHYRPNLQRNYQTQNRYLIQISNNLVRRQDAIDQSIVRSQLLSRGLAGSETPIIILDAQGAIVSCSESAESLLGVAPQSLAGQPIGGAAGALFADLDLDPEAESAMTTLRLPNNLPLAVSTSAVKNKHSTLTGWVLRLHTSEIAQRDAARQSAPVLPIAPTLQKYLGGIQQLLTMMPSLVARQDVQLRVVGQMQRMVAEMNSQVNRLGLLQALDAQSQLTTEAVQVGQLAQGVIEEMRPRAAAQQIALRADIHEMLPIIHGDAAQICLALRELLDNALRFAPVGSSIEVAVRRQNGAVVLSVSDSGQGIHTDQQAHIFEPFFRAEGADQSGAGGGLGLALVRAITRAHGGVAAVQSAPGQGSLFTISLPISN